MARATYVQVPNLVMRVGSLLFSLTFLISLLLIVGLPHASSALSTDDDALQPDGHFRLVTGTSQSGAIHSMKWHDVNSDGSWDSGEPALPGWEIHIEGDNTISLTKITGDLGLSWFTDLPVGNYTVTEVLQNGWAQTLPGEGYHSDPLEPRQTIQGLDFGNHDLLPRMVFLPAILRNVSTTRRGP